jgi:hypothetical protein
MNTDLKLEFQYFLDNKAELLREFEGKFVVIKDQHVIGSFDKELEAIEATTNDHELGTFLVQKVEAGEGEYTQTFHSRVAFA